MIVFATVEIARARSISIGCSLSFSASSVSNRWLRRSPILFFTFPSSHGDGPIDRAGKLDYLFQLGRQIMNGHARGMVSARKQLKIGERVIQMVAVFPPDAMPLRNRAVRVFPDQLVHPLPAVIGLRAGLPGFQEKVAVGVDAERPETHRVSRLLAFLELRLAHAAAKPSRTA